jgi:hypothetical protein
MTSDKYVPTLLVQIGGERFTVENGERKSAEEGGSGGAGTEGHIRVEEKSAAGRCAACADLTRARVMELK